MRTVATLALDEEERQMVDEFVVRIRHELGTDLAAVWLYGSRARGERHADSDIDLLVVVNRNLKNHDMEVISAAAEINLAHSRYKLAAFAQGLEWLSNRREIESFFIQEVDRDKVPLYGDDL